MRKIWSRILEWYKRRKGLLNKRGSFVNYAEVHSLVLGISDGIFAVFDPKATPYNYLEKAADYHDDVDNQRHYYQKPFTLTLVSGRIVVLHAVLKALGYGDLW